jgi:hypothetical protein
MEGITASNAQLLPEDEVPDADEDDGLHLSAPSAMDSAPDIDVCATQHDLANKPRS